MSKTKKDWITNWLIIDEGSSSKAAYAPGRSGSDHGQSPYQIGSGFRSFQNQASASPESKATPEPDEEARTGKKSSSSSSLSSRPKKSLLAKKKFKFSEVEETELTRSPISGTYILKEWKGGVNVKSARGGPKSAATAGKDGKEGFSKDEVNLNKIAASFVQITPQAKAKLAKIPNKIGPFECKLCKVVYSDAFQLAMHNCPRVVCIEYKCSECNKSFNCPANLASHKRWHRPKVTVEATSQSEQTPSTSKASNVPKPPELNAESGDKSTKHPTAPNRPDERPTLTMVKNEVRTNYHDAWTHLVQQYAEALSNYSGPRAGATALSAHGSSFLQLPGPPGGLLAAAATSEVSLSATPSPSPSAFQPAPFGLGGGSLAVEQSDWLNQVYSNYFMVATQKLLSSSAGSSNFSPAPRLFFN